MESFNTSVSAQQLEQLLQPGTDMGQFFSVFFVPGSANYDQLVLELQREFRQGGSPDVTRLRIDRVKYNPETLAGTLRVVLDVQFTFGCEDSITDKKDQTSEWTFKLNPTYKTITFYNSPFAEARSTADEF